MPGSVLDAATATECATYVTSVVLGYDLVCRLSFSTLVKFREQVGRVQKYCIIVYSFVTHFKVLDCICRARVNKMIIMQAIFREGHASSYLYRPEQEPPNPLRTSIREFIVSELTIYLIFFNHSLKNYYLEKNQFSY
jgi:hypothetical protein